MRLRKIQYSEYEGTPQEWVLEEFLLSDVNLLVGKNASGKTRVINVIHNLSLAIGGRLPLTLGIFRLEFEHDSEVIKYELEKREDKVFREVFSRGSSTLLERRAGGFGRIHANALGKELDFQSPEDQLAIVSRRDKLQHPFFEPIHEWAQSVYCYRFGTTLGQQHVAVFVAKGLVPVVPVDAKNPDTVVGMYRDGEKRFGEAFAEAVRQDLAKVGYSIEKVGLMTPTRVQFTGPGELMGLYVKEEDLPGETDQTSMSQGMFRALSLLVQVNYAILANKPSCILVDDIGEGLDFERSCGLIDVLMSRAKSSAVQLIMATNDRFVMNRVPLEAWSVLCRKSGRVSVRNYQNSKDLFDRFSATGLSNFDFLAFDYVNQP